MGGSLPRLEAYLASLPDGLDSFPDCQAKAALFRENLKQLPVHELPSSVPARIRTRLLDGDAMTSWVPECEYNAAFLTLLDVHDVSDADAPRVWYRVTAALIASPIYKFALGLFSRERILRGVSAQWGIFHRGTEMEVGGTTERTEFSLVSPAALMPPVVQRAYGDVMLAVMESCRDGRGVRVEVVSQVPGRITFATSELRRATG